MSDKRQTDYTESAAKLLLKPHDERNYREKRISALSKIFDDYFWLGPKKQVVVEDTPIFARTINSRDVRCHLSKGDILHYIGNVYGNLFYRVVSNASEDAGTASCKQGTIIAIYHTKDFLDKHSTPEEEKAKDSLRIKTHTQDHRSTR